MNKMKCVTGNNGKDEATEITVFSAKWCGACKTRVPEIVRKAKAAELKVKIVDIDDENLDSKTRKMLKRVEFVPHIDYMGH